jgi:hypothetical protein
MYLIERYTAHNRKKLFSKHYTITKYNTVDMQIKPAVLVKQHF